MARKPKPAPIGAPMWVLTYGDMMSLLLCFFVLLASLANFEDVDDRFKAAIQSIREALGMTGQVGTEIDPSLDFHSLIHKLESIIKPNQPRQKGDTEEKGVYGKNIRLRRISDGMEITIGGPIMFEHFSTELTEEGKQALAQIGDALKGHRNKVEIRGHAAEEPRPADWTYDDAMELSYQRAKYVANELILRGIDPRTVRLVAVGANEPVTHKAFNLESQGDERRVEIIVRESLIDDYIGQPPAGGSITSQPATQPETQQADTLYPTQID